MAKSCIHIQKRNTIDALIHNARVYGLSYAIDDAEGNYTEYMRTSREIQSLPKYIKIDYQEHSYRGRRLPSNSEPIKEGVMNLNESHTNEEVMRVAKRVAKKLGVELLGVSIHRDEGHIGKDGEMIKNYHAHLLFNYYDFKTHKIVHQTSLQMKQLQTIIAEELQMERGTAKSITKRKHIEHGQYRVIAKERDEAIERAVAKEKITVKEMKIKIEELRKKLAEKNKELEERGKDKVYTKEDYRALGELKKATNKNTLEEIYESFMSLQDELRKKDEHIKKRDNKELIGEKLFTEEDIKSLRSHIMGGYNKEDVEAIIKKANSKINRLNENFNKMKNIILDREYYIDELQEAEKTLQEAEKMKQEAEAKEEAIRKFISNAIDDNIISVEDIETVEEIAERVVEGVGVDTTLKDEIADIRETAKRAKTRNMEMDF